MPKKPNFTLYFNPDEIATAIAEVRGSVLVETVTKKGTDKSRKGSIDLGLGSGILSLLRIGKASLKAEKGSTDRQELTERSEFPIEAQLESLLSDLQSYLGTGFFTRLDDAYSYLPSEGSCWVAISERWDLPAFYGGEGVELLNVERRFLFTIGDEPSDYHHDDLYFKRRQRLYRAEMAASFDRCPRLKGRQLGWSSHEALYFRNYGGKGIPLQVFGFLLKVKNKLQVIPYKIWV